MSTIASARVCGLLSLGVAIAAAAAPRAVSAPPEATVIRAPGIIARFAPDGKLAGVALGEKGVERAARGWTSLEGCRQVGDATTRTLADGGIEFQRTLEADGGKRCSLIDRFQPTPTSIRWEVEIQGQGQGEPWTTDIRANLAYPATPDSRFWTAWSDPEQRHHEPFQTSEWADPLVSRPLRDIAFDYGAPASRPPNLGPGWCPFEGNLISLPLVSLLEPAEDLGLSLILSPEGVLRDATLGVTSAGAVGFVHRGLRIDGRRPVRFALDLVVHEASWRGPLRWMTGRYPQYFDPPNPRARELSGTGAYSNYEGDFDVDRYRKMAFRTNWRASFDFPYMGMFLPPVEPAQTWSRFGGGTISIAAMAADATRMRGLGFHVLSYFNVTEFGARIPWPLPPAPTDANSDTNLWRNGGEFLSARMPDAVLRQPASDTMFPSWEGAVVMDCGDPSYRAFLLDQARRHAEMLPDADGVCIDRLDWLRFYNDRADDGESWYEGGPARSLIASWNKLMDELGPLMRDRDKVIFVNNHYKRLDLLRHVDGIFDEFTYAPSPLNLTAFLALRKPALGWTSEVANLKPDPDAYFQRHLYLGVFPMAPFPGNDHSIKPDPWGDQWYLDYGPLLAAIRGKRWVLTPRCVEVTDQAARANLFETADGFAAPVVFGGSAAEVEVVLRGLPKLPDTAVAEAILPGVDQPVVAPIRAEADGTRLRAPLSRGCALVRIQTNAKTLDAPQPTGGQP